MFFSLAAREDPRFPRQYQLGRLILNADSGWQIIHEGNRKIVFKGYAESAPLSDLVTTECQSVMGNFCAFDHDSAEDLITIKTNLYRSFDLWTDGHTLSNLDIMDQKISADKQVIVHQDMQIHQQRINVIGTIDTTVLPRQQLLDQVHDRLSQRIARFVATNTLPLRIFVSGGVDSMLVFSYIQRCTDRFEMTFMDHMEWDPFWCRNQDHLRSNFWGYRQIHHWLEPCVLSTGSPGDEFMLRSPTTANLWLRSHGTSIPQLLSDGAGDRYLHSQYFNRNKHRDIFADQEKLPDSIYQNRKIFYWQLLDNLLNDQQHWHLGNTLTFTPLRDLEISKLFLRLNLDDGIDQIMNSGISRELIARNNPNLLDYLSDKKNTGEVLANMPGLMSRYRAVSSQ